MPQRAVQVQPKGSEHTNQKWKIKSWLWVISVLCFTLCSRVIRLVTKKYFSKTSDWQTLARNLGYTYPCVAYTNEHALENKMKLRGRDAALPLLFIAWPTPLKSNSKRSRHGGVNILGQQTGLWSTEAKVQGIVCRRLHGTEVVIAVPQTIPSGNGATPVVYMPSTVMGLCWWWLFNFPGSCGTNMDHKKSTENLGRL
jgi:hypothetical protein